MGLWSNPPPLLKQNKSSNKNLNFSLVQVKQRIKVKFKVNHQKKCENTEDDKYYTIESLAQRSISFHWFLLGI